MKQIFGSLLKYLVFGTNIIVFIASGICLGFGIASLVGEDSGLMIVTDSSGIHDETVSPVTTSKGAEIAVTVVSAVAVVAAFLGCFGALRENRFLIFLYFLLILMTALLGMSAFSNFNNKLVSYDIRQDLTASMVRYDPNNTHVHDVQITEAWDAAQEKYGCCGVDSYVDWVNSKSFPDLAGDLVPASCCSGLDADADDAASLDCRRRPYGAQYADRMQGCYEHFQRDFEKAVRSLVISSGTLTLVMFINLIVIFAFGLLLSPSHKNGYQEVQ